jgi:AraC-like DNA-binding protein
MLFEHNSDEIGSSDAIKSIMTQMIIAMHRAYERRNTRHNEQSKIVAVRNAIAQNPEKRWTLESMAAMSGYSVSRFSELYRSRYNISPVNDVIAYRISYAKALLLSGQTTVSYVADACGFSTLNYFSKLFKASVGCSPSEYMRKHGR